MANAQAMKLQKAELEKKQRSLQRLMAQSPMLANPHGS